LIGPAYPLRGGIADFNEALCNAFQKAEFISHIYSFSLQYPRFLFPGKTQYKDSPAPENINIISSINSVNPFSWFRTARLIKKEKPDFVVVHFWMPFMAPALGTIIKRIKKRTDIKVIAVTHNVIPHEKRPGDKILTKNFIKACDGYVTLAQSVLDDLGQFTDNTNKKFIPHPVYDTFGEKTGKQEAQKYLNLNPEDRHLLFFGIIRKYKGLDLLLKAMGIPKVKDLNIKLIVAGEFYENKDGYLGIVKNSGIDDRIIFTDSFIKDDEVKYYFSAADMIIQPYHTATQSGVTQIAYHFERPMLVTDVGGLAEIVADGKVGYVTEKTPESVADAIYDFYSQNREQEFSANVAVEKSRFSWENMVDGIKELLDG